MKYSLSDNREKRIFQKGRLLELLEIIIRKVLLEKCGQCVQRA